MAEILKQLYYDPKNGYLSQTKFIKKVKEQHPDITRKEITDFLNAQYAIQVTKESKKPKIFNTILAKEPKSNYQMDLMIYTRYEINKYKYILCIIDVHSRYVQAVPLTSRKNEVLLKKIKEIFDTIGYPKNINCDNEFNNNNFLSFFKTHNITPHFSDVGEINKNAIVERFNRTLANLIQRWRVGSKRYDWFKVLPDLIDNYNKTYHRTIKAKPYDVFYGKDNNKQTNIVQLEPSLEVGDIIRIKEVKDVLKKGDYVKYSKDSYLITRKSGKRYYIKNTRTDEFADRPYKDYEMKKVNEIVSLENEQPEEVDAKNKRFLKRNDIRQENIINEPRKRA